MAKQRLAQSGAGCSTVGNRSKRTPCVIWRRQPLPWPNAAGLSARAALSYPSRSDGRSRHRRRSATGSRISCLSEGSGPMTLLHSSAPRWFALAVLLLLPAAAWSDIKALTADQDGKPQKLWVYVGTYTGGNSKGIYRLELDLASGKLTL